MIINRSFIITGQGHLRGSRLGIQLLVPAQVMISQFGSLSPMSDSVLTAQSLEPALNSVPPSLSALPLLTCFQE